MSVTNWLDWLPFFGIALDALGALLLAWAHLLNRRPEIEHFFRSTIGVGAVLIFCGFFLLALDFLGHQYKDYGNALLYIFVATLVSSAIYVGLSLFLRWRRNGYGAGTPEATVHTDQDADSQHLAGLNNIPDMRSWIISEINRNQAYHNHKETMAWVATAFYIPGIIMLGYWSPKLTAAWMWIAVILTLFILCILMLFFLRFQFSNRSIAAGRITGLVQVVQLLQSGWLPRQDELIIRTNDLYPLFIESRSNPDDDLRRIEWITYATIIFSTIIAILLLIFKII